MSCLFLKHDQQLSEMINQISGGQDRQPFTLPGTEKQYAPDRLADVTHIKLTLSFDIEKNSMKGICQTTFIAIKEQLTSVELDAAEMVISRIEDRQGDTLTYEHTGEKLRIHLNQLLEEGEETKVSIHYQVEDPRLGLYFIKPTKDYPEKPVQIWTQGQDEDSKYWFPCLDYPNEKATSEVVATVPENFFVLSNGELVETTHEEQTGTKTYHWKHDIPHVSYLISLVAGEFIEQTDYYNDIPISYYVPPGREADGARSFSKTPDMVRYFSEKLDYKYPYKKYAQITVDDFVFGGMENTTATTQTSLTLHDERAHLDFKSEPLVAHELAHQWFGDLLTCKDWSHAWLNEGFATYFEALYREYDLGDAEFRYELYQNAKRYFQEDKKYRRPVVTAEFKEPIDVFDRHLYEKGSLILHMLRFELGDTLFWKSIRHYLRKHAGGNVETIDLIRAIEDVSGRNMKQFFDQWVFSGGYPEVRCQYSWSPSKENNGGTVKLTIKQTQETNTETPLFRFPIEVQFVHENNEVSETLNIRNQEHTFYFNFPSQPQQVLVDPENWILKSLSLEFPQELLRSQLHKAKAPLARIHAATALKKSPGAANVDALTEALLQDEFWGVKVEVATTLSEIGTERAMRGLVDGLALNHPKARRAVVESLGNFHSTAAVEALSPYADSDTSYFVEAAANASLGKTRVDGVSDIILESLAKDSFNEVIRSKVFEGLAELNDPETIPIFRKYLKPGQPPMARTAAARAFGKLQLELRTIGQELADLLNPEEHFRVKIGAISGLQSLNSSRYIGSLKQFAAQEPNGMLRRLAAVAARTIQKSQTQSNAVRELQDTVDKLQEERRHLIERLEKLESHNQSNS